MQHDTSTKLIKRRMQEAMNKFFVSHELFASNEQFTDERPSQQYRVILTGPNRFFCGQARYEGPEGTWLCWMNRDAIRISGTPVKKDNDVAVFGIEQYDVVGSRSDEDISDILRDTNELVFQTGSHWTIEISRVASVDVLYQIMWRNANEEIMHTTYYSGLDALQQIRDKEALNLHQFHITRRKN